MSAPQAGCYRHIKLRNQILETTLPSPIHIQPTQEFMEKHLRAALDNITKHGDTDVFPFPIENHIFFDKPAEALQILKNVHTNFNSTLINNPPVNQGMLTAVGYTGFRWATQIDPLWNAYLLALVLKIAPDIESKRI